MYIYALRKNKPLIISVPTNPSRIVVSDGFHITKPLNVTYGTNRTHYFKIACAVADDQLLVGFVIMILLYAAGATSGIILLQLMSLAPILFFLFLYYINRKEFIRIQPA